MELIEWKDEYLTGIKSVDHEHELLVQMINSLLQQLSDVDDAEAVLHALGEIHAHSQAHFALEEKVMLSHRYEGYKEHKADHEYLLDEVREMMDEYEDTASIDAENFSHRICQWFSGHFKKHDGVLHKKLGV